MISHSTISRRGGFLGLAAGICALIVGLCMLAPAQSAYAADTDQTGKIGMHRMYNPNSGEHFYTASTFERNSLITNGWQYEGTGWLAPATSDTPVYRLYSGTDHHYTTSLEEKEHLEKVGWSYEDIGWYSADKKTGEPLYRQFNPNVDPQADYNNSGSHNYTTSKAENDSLVKTGWNEEGIGWYALVNDSTIENDGSYVAVEADMNLKGSGTGSHAKVDISSTAGNAVASFGIQYEQNMSYKYSQFPNNTCFLVENVMSHATEAGPEGKEYFYVSPAELGSTARVRIAWFKDDNTLRFYVNGREISRTAATFADGTFIVATEGSVAHNGDQIDAAFSNVKVKGKGGMVDLKWDLEDHFGLKGAVSKGSNGLPSMTVTGTANIPGINPATGTPWDWDTCFQTTDPTTGTSGHPLSATIKAAIL